MKRHLVHSLIGSLALLFCLTVSTGRAQTNIVPGSGAGIFNDPFSFYYAIYLPNQQVQALRPSVQDPINSAMVSRQYYAQQRDRSLYDPISPYSNTYDPLRPFSRQEERLARPQRFVHSPSNSTGQGPSLYFNRVHQYFPDLAGRTPHNRNANVAGGRAAGRMGTGGMGGMGGMGMGTPGGGMF